MLLTARAVDASICPSEVARRLWPEPGWRDAMPTVRRVACALASDGVLRITRGDAELDPRALSDGPIRLRRGADWRDPAPDGPAP